MNNYINLKIADESERKLLKNLYSLYLHDLSEFTDSIDITKDGVLIWDSEEVYWEDSNLIPMIARYKNNVVGFVLLSNPPYVKVDCDYCIQEFFILRKYRGKGLGKKTIEILFKKHKGKYCLQVLKDNKNALEFWHKIYNHNNITYEESLIDVGDDECYSNVFAV